MKPVTPLPFKAIDRSDLCTLGSPAGCYWFIEGGSGFLDQECTGGFSISTYIRPEDAKYIVHACNAYPKLIAMLQRPPLADDCLALLRELGEIK